MELAKPWQPLRLAEGRTHVSTIVGFIEGDPPVYDPPVGDTPYAADLLALAVAPEAQRAGVGRRRPSRSSP